MQKYSWKKQENTELGEPGSYERLRKPLHGPTCVQFEQSYIILNMLNRSVVTSWK